VTCNANSNDANGRRASTEALYTPMHSVDKSYPLHLELTGRRAMELNCESAVDDQHDIVGGKDHDCLY